MNDTQRKLHLINAAREMASNWLEQAVKTATTEEQLTNQVTLIEMACLHALAICAFNHEMFLKVRGDDVVDAFADDVKDELKIIKDAGEMEIVSIQGMSH